MMKKLVSIILILLTFLMFKTSNVYALDSPPYGLQIPSSNTFYPETQRLPYRLYGNSYSSNRVAVSVFSSYGLDIEKQTYIIFEVCAPELMEFGISNSSTDEAYISSKNVQFLVTNKRCSLYNENDSWKHLVYTQVGKWSVPSGGADVFYVDSYFIMNGNNVVWDWTADITNIYITDTNTYEQDYANYQALRQNQTIINQNQATNDKLNDLDNSINSDSDDTTSKSCGIICKLKGIFTGIIELPGKLINLLIDALKSLFIPDDMTFLTDLVDSLEDKLGFIAEVPITMIEFMLDLVSMSWEEMTTITFPTIEVFGYYFWEEQVIDVTLLLEKLKPYRYVTNMLCVGLCVATLQKWYNRFNGGGE